MTGCGRVCVVLTLCVLVWGKEHGHHGPKVPHMEDGEHHDDFDHQSILGSEDQDEEFAGLPPEEAKERLKEMVNEHDLDKDGFITKEELTKWIVSSYQKLDRDDAMEKFKEEDANGDKLISWQEFLKSAYSFGTDDVEKMRIKAHDTGDNTDESQLKLVDDDAQFFKAADLNGDGSLSEEEYMAFYYPPNHEHMHPLEVARYVRDTDTDGDGKISKAEFTPEQADDQSRISSEENFADLDKDKDGFLTEEEVKEWVIPQSDEMVDDEVKHLMEMAESDGDKGRLSVKEILDKTSEFVGSSATDYGNFFGRHDEL